MAKLKPNILRLPLFIARRIAFNREKSFSRFIISIALSATALSVAVMILSTAVVNGFQQVVSQKIFSFWGHIHIMVYQPNTSPLTEEVPFDASDSLEQAIRAMPEVRSLDRYATKSTIIKTSDETEGVIFKGVAKDYHWNNIKRFLISGHLPVYPDSGYSDQFLISDLLAKKLKLKVNDKVIIYFIQNANELPRARKLTISGIYKTSVEEYDKTYIIGDIRLLNKLNGWAPEQIGGYEIFLHDYRKMDTISEQIYENLPMKLTTLTIRQIYPNIFDWLRLQNMNELIIIIIMAIVAIINMITAILILILERTRMVGVLKALGMREWNIRKIFIYQASYIMITGLIIGNIFGLGLAYLQKTTGFFTLPEESYYMPVAPILIKWWQVAVIDVATLLVCVLILIVPSIIIKRIRLVKAIAFR